MGDRIQVVNGLIWMHPELSAGMLFVDYSQPQYLTSRILAIDEFTVFWKLIFYAYPISTSHITTINGQRTKDSTQAAENVFTDGSPTTAAGLIQSFVGLQTPRNDRCILTHARSLTH